ncbi:MAG: carboxypeptidase regulatory-like domain-containing protein [Polyangiaceae bacterium]
MARGDFALWVDPGLTRVEVSATGYAPGHASGRAPEQFFSVHLVPGATLIGRAVIAGTETPVEGATIEAIQVEGGNTRASTHSDTEGRFKVEGLLPGRYRIEATSEGREGYSRSSVTLSLGETSQEVLVELDPAYVVRGRVVDKKSGEGCTGGTVIITDEKQNEFSEANIGADGWARMASVIPGHYKVDVRCKGYRASRKFPDIVISNQDAPEQLWQVEKGASIRVSLVVGGKPSRQAFISAHRERGEGEPRGRVREGEGQTAVTDHPESDGSFLLSGLSAGKYRVTARIDGDHHEMREVELAGENEEKLTIDVPSRSSIEGLVEDADHRPVGSVMVRLQGPHFAQTQTLEDGTFRFGGLEKGSYTVSAIDGGFTLNEAGDGPKNMDSASARVSVGESESTKVKLRVSRHDGTIEGRVVDGSGHPVTDAFISVAPSAGGAIPTRFFDPSHPPSMTDTEGKFRVERLAQGEYNVRAYRNGGGEAQVEKIKTGTQNLELKLSDSASISGVLTSNGVPVERFTLEVINPSAHFMRSELFFHSAGVFSIKELPAGSYRIVADTPQGRAQGKVDLADGEQKSGIALDMALYATLEGTIIDGESGQPLQGVWIELRENGANAVTDDKGHFVFREVPGGGYTLHVSESAQHAATEQRVEVARDGSTTTVAAIRVAKREVPNENHAPEGPSDNDNAQGADEPQGE